MHSTFFAVFALAVSTLAIPVVEKRQSATTCGSNYYSSSQLSSAYQAGYSYYQGGSEAGDSDYPHQYEDYEGFSFGGVQGPYQEFPILESGVYNGGSPGADRVIFNEQGQYAGAITHTGASGNNFVGCSGTS